MFIRRVSKKLIVLLTAFSILLLIYWQYWLGSDTIKSDYLNLKTLPNKKMGLIVNTSTCEIGDFDLWDPQMLPFIKNAPALECNNTLWHYRTQVNGNELILEGISESDGYSSCCYKVITRVQLSDDKYDELADWRISFSDCVPILKERTKIEEEFIMVECSSNLVNKLKTLAYVQNVIPNSATFRSFHAFPVVDNSSMKKIEFWKQRSAKREFDKPPNVLIIGFDSTSRLNFRRQMPQTKNVLEIMGATEMLGYTKVGANTFPNMLPALFGYSEEDLNGICYFSNQAKLDDCPSIWKRLHAANYLTAHTEDSPEYAIFNYLKTGFVRKPVDFYPRPLSIAADQYGHHSCVGLGTTDEATISYVKELIELSNKSQTPFFSLSWSTENSHDDYAGLHRSDDAYAQFILGLQNKGYLENTVLIFMGDHGYRFGSIRETHIGYFEDKLPAFWISLPKSVEKRFPYWSNALQINSRRLSSPFTLYWTLNRILDVFTQTPSPSDSKDRNGTTIARKYQQTFLDIIPESNSCEDTGIPETYCACYPINHVELDDPLLIASARLSIQKINRDILTPICLQLKISEIVAGVSIKKRSKDHIETVRYIVGFRTHPGNFLFEAEINYFPHNKTFSASPDVQRTSKIDKSHVKCVSDSKLELFCLCK